VNQLAWLHAERGAVDTLTVYQNVAVNNHLTSLGNGTSETCTQNQRVKTHL
jgi:hypothetical protein